MVKFEVQQIYIGEYIKNTSRSQREWQKQKLACRLPISTLKTKGDGLSPK
jgi:hypothetical protein